MKEEGKESREKLLGDDYSCQLRKYVRKEKIIGKENDSYIEVVTDKKSGEILHEWREPLSKHKGYGSNKNMFTNEVFEQS